MPNQPGVRVVQTTQQDVIAPVEAELPTCIIGPLYEVFIAENAPETFDPLQVSNTVVAWPNKRIGTVVDLDGTRNGLIDSQKRTTAEMIPTVYLVDGTIVVEVDDEDIEAISQTGFELKQDARTDLEIDTFNFFALSLNNSTFLYNPEGGLSDMSAGDRLNVGATSATVASVSDTRVTTEEDISGEALVPVSVEQDEGGTVDVNVTTSPTPGRVVVSVSGTDFATEVPGIAVNDVAVTAIPMTGLTTVQGQISDGDGSFDEIDELLVDLPVGGDTGFGVNVTFADVENYVVRVVNYGADSTFTTIVQTYFTTLTAIDTTTGTVGVADAVGIANDDYVEVTIMESQVGYVESINAPTNDEIVVVVPNTFSDSLSFVDVYTTSISADVYPEFNIRVDYRANRKDLANTGLAAQSTSELLEATGHSSVDYRDGLGWAVRVATLAQPNGRDVQFVPVDVEPDGTTGLPENRDLTTGYADALEAAESLDVYNIVPLNRSAAIDSAVQVHVTTMSTEVENAWRRGYFIEKVPLGSTESEFGEIAAGRVSGGIAGDAAAGNAVIRDASVDFVTEANVVEGTQVVVVSPLAFAGTHTALGTTTDNDLILDIEGEDTVFTPTKEFAVAGTVDVNTSAADTHVISGAGIPADNFANVEAGDYAEVTVGGAIYRLKILSATGTTLTVTDEVPGSLDFGSGLTDNGSLLSVIRTWGPDNLPAVEYYIDPLSRSEQTTQVAASQSLANRRFTATLDHSPTMEISDGVEAELDPSLTLVAIAAKRSGLRSFDETTNLTLGGGIISVKYGFGTFKRSQLKTMSDAGLTLVTQKTPTSEPYIRDHITTDTSGLVTQEELVTANGDWISKTLRSTYVAPPGAKLEILTKRLIGIRTMQIDAILKSWLDEGRLISYTLVDVSQNSLNKRQLDIVLTLVMPVAEKEIEFTIELTV